MNRRVLLGLAPLCLAATAYAQAPGEYGPSTYAPSPPPPPPAAHYSRFSIGLNFAATEVKSDQSDDKVGFSGVSFALRYRATPHLELEAEFGGGRESSRNGASEDMSTSELAMGFGTLAARYRFNPWDHWNWWLLAGVGATTIAPHDASDQTISDSYRGHFAYGVGMEYRFVRFALQAELRGYALGQTDQEMANDADPKLSAGSFSLGGNFYF
ncbi:MAG TPA: outer membrane beta-barrel protein [Kofleriaceae bacterium]|jgi:opacity protein-like surface antigen